MKPVHLGGTESNNMYSSSAQPWPNQMESTSSAPESEHASVYKPLALSGAGRGLRGICLWMALRATFPGRNWKKHPSRDTILYPSCKGTNEGGRHWNQWKSRILFMGRIRPSFSMWTLSRLTAAIIRPGQASVGIRPVICQP